MHLVYEQVLSRRRRFQALLMQISCIPLLHHIFLDLGLLRLQA